MSGFSWQDVVAAALAVLAVWYLVRRRSARPKPPLVQMARAKRPPPQE